MHPELTAQPGDVHLNAKDVVPRLSPQVVSRSRFRWGRVAVLLVLGGLCPGTTSTAWAQDTPSGTSKDLSASKQAYEEGLRAYNLGKWEQAAASFARAYEHSGDAALLFNVGQAQRFAGQAGAALIAYKAFLREKPGAANRPLVEAKIRELEAEPVTLRAPALDTPAQAKAEPVMPPAPPAALPLPTPEPPVNPESAGSPALNFSPPSPEPSPAPLATSTPVQETAPAARSRGWVWSAVAVVVVAGAVTGIVLATGGSKRELSCGPGVDKCTTGGF